MDTRDWEKKLKALVLPYRAYDQSGNDDWISYLEISDVSDLIRELLEARTRECAQFMRGMVIKDYSGATDEMLKHFGIE